MVRGNEMVSGTLIDSAERDFLGRQDEQQIARTKMQLIKKKTFSQIQQLSFC